MIIECVLKRAEPVVVPIGNETYSFADDGTGRKVAEVWLESHIESFLAVPHLYREVSSAEKPATGEQQKQLVPPAPKPAAASTARKPAKSAA